jgi:hypothetical protein
LATRYRELYGDGSYLPDTYQHEIGARVRMAARRYGLHRPDPAQIRDVGGNEDQASPAARQLTLL